MADLRQAAPSLAKDSMAAEAARALLKLRMKAVAKLVKQARDESAPRRVHQLRVATRRASAAVEAFLPWLEARSAVRLSRRLKRIRRAAGRVRQHDVHIGMLEQLAKAAPEGQERLIRRLVSWTQKDREAGAADLGRTLERRGAGLGALTRRALANPDQDGAPGATFLEAARPVVDAVRSEVAAAAAGDIADLAGLHALRLALKHLRYAAELFRPCLSERFERIMPALTRAQDVFGAVNDSGEMVRHLEDLAVQAQKKSVDKETPDLTPPIRALGARYASVHDRRHREALSWWEGFVHGGALDVIDDLLPAPARDAPPVLSSNGDQAPFPLINRHVEFAGTLFPRRLAAIDVGTNSIRLIIAEASPDGTYRVLDDEKEVVRLGQGMANTGRLTDAAMQRAAAAIARMRSIAEGYGVAVLRVIGTSAAREARNGRHLVDLVRRIAGVELEVISADEEARLAFLSVSRAFDIQSAPVAVVDIGGGSTEVILSAAGVVEKVYALGLGAVRLTDRFGGPERASGDRYRRVREFVRDCIADQIGQPPMAPQTVIGTGGTFAAVASMDRARLGSAAPASIQGYDLRRSDIRHLLDRLRKSSRDRFPGLAPDRADIIVPGMAIIDGLLRHLGVNRVLVHDRGIRDGLLLTMIREHLPGLRPLAPARPDPLASARRFARACRYEEAHAEHVARLALSMFEQLAAQGPAPWATPESHVILESAAVLHDVGYLINYARHHKHSYHLIMHAELDGLTPRQLELVANVARYHRRAEPAARHAGFRRLASADRDLVVRLAAILRAADGLDRTHTQAVKAVEVKVDRRRGIAHMIVDTLGSGATDLWGAERKNGLFRRAFELEPRFALGAPAMEKAPADGAEASKVESDDAGVQQPASNAFR
jgi:exopolyphosphatase / guanosine-5'-triphosphate,3'-diphosphate pyrophosphatase